MPVKGLTLAIHNFPDRCCHQTTIDNSLTILEPLIHQVFMNFYLGDHEGLMYLMRRRNLRMAVAFTTVAVYSDKPTKGARELDAAKLTRASNLQDGLPRMAGLPSGNHVETEDHA